MANFSTEFPIDPKNSVDDVLRLALAWVGESPHTRLPGSELVDLPVDGEREVRAEEDSLVIATASQPDYEIGGVRYVQVARGLEWTSTMVTVRTRDRHVLSFQVACEALSTLVRLPEPKKPQFIRLALERLGGGMDGEIPVAAQPFRLSDGEASVAAALMNGTAMNQLPIVYVSTDFRDGHTLDADRLSGYVSGMAHVVVEPSRAFSLELKTLTEARNVFGGTVGVYWPESTARRSYYLDDSAPDARTLELKIAQDIRTALANRRQRMNATWAHLRESVTGRRLARIKEDGSSELADYVKAFDADQEAKQLRLDEANQEIARLNAEVRTLSARHVAQERGLIRRGTEQDLYESEIADIISDALEAAVQSVKADTRREDVLRDLVAANPASRARQGIEDELKALFKDYRSMDGRLRSALSRLGFTITDDGKHHKAVFRGDDRYTYSIPKTSSDVRAGRNTASGIINLLF